MKWVLITLVVALGIVPAVAGAQQPMTQQDQAMRMQRMQETMARMDRVMQNVRELNHMMIQQRAQQGLREMGQNMERACERLQLMIRDMDRLQKDATLQRDRDRVRQMDELHDRLRDMLQQMDQARDALHKIASP